MRLLPDEAPKDETSKEGIVKEWCIANLRKPPWILSNGTVFMRSSRSTWIPQTKLLAAFQEEAAQHPELQLETEHPHFFYTLLGPRCITVFVQDGVPVYRIRSMETVRRHFIKDGRFDWGWGGGDSPLEKDIVKEWCITNLRKPNWILNNGTAFIQSGVITRVPKTAVLAAFQEEARKRPKTNHPLFTPDMTIYNLTRFLNSLFGYNAITVSVQMEGPVRVPVYRVHPMETVRTEFASYFLKDVHFKWT